MKNIEAKINIDSSQLKSAFTGIDNLIGKIKSAFAPQKVVIDAKDATKEIDELKKSIGSMQGELMRMAKSGGAGSEEYVALQAKIKGARGELKLLADNSENVGNSLFNAGKKGSNAFGFLADTLKVAGGQLLANGIQSLATGLKNAAEAGINFEKSLADFSALTGVGGEALKGFGDSARNLSKEFGTDAISQIETFKGILSRLGPDIAKSPEA